VRLLEGLGAGEQVVLRVRRNAYAGRLWSPAPPGSTGPARGWPEVGDVIVVRGKLEPLGAFDAYQARRNAHGALAATRVVPTGERRGGALGALDGIRRAAERGLEHGLAAPEAALLRGMVLGQDERLTRDVKEAFQASGLAHILAVSGQNVMLLAILVLAAGALVGLPLRARLMLAAALIALYVPLTGAGPSIQRAGVMSVAGLVAALAGRPSRRWYALLLAAAVTLLLNPRAAGEPGWQLSFAAVVALLVAAGPLREALERRMPRPVAEAAAITIAATAGTAPLMALHFGEVSLAALPANLLAAPAVAPVMWLGVLAAAAAQAAEPLAAPFTALTGPLLVYLQAVARVTGDTPLSVVRVDASPAAIAAGAVALVAVVLAAVRRWRGLRAWLSQVPPARRRVHRLIASFGVSAVALLAVAGGVPGDDTPPRAGPGVLRVSFLDVGQGDATLIELDGTTVLVDTGPPDGPILDRLEQAGVGRLDALMLTHAEADHEGAAPEVIARHRPRLIVDGGAGWPSAVQRMLPAAAASARSRRMTPAAGQTISVGGLRFEVLWPPARRPATGNPNDLALVSRLEVGAFSMLLSADAESHVTQPLALEPVDVLKVAHHGSADPGLPALLDQLRPRFAAIEVGANTYGHPTPSTVQALERTVPEVVRTDRDGTIRLQAVGDRLWLR
jgi:competence protein ComEC